MQSKQDQPDADAALRRAAQARLNEMPAPTPSQTRADQRQIHHELRVHQVELELRNEQLSEAQVEIEAHLQRYSDLFESAPVAYFDLTADGTILLANLTGARLLGVEHGELADRRFQLFLAEPIRAAFSNFLQQVFATEVRQTCEIVLTRKDRSPLFVRFEAARSGDGKSCRTLIVDLTERKRAEAVLESRMRLSEYAMGHSLDELLTRTLDEAELLTGSTIGFFHFVEADQKTLSLQSWSTNTLRNMCSAEGKGRHYEADQAGVWADALRERRPMIHNDYANLAHRKGLPPGHAPVLRELVVPLLRNEQVVALLGVGNKPGDYGPEDIESVFQLAKLAWDIVLAKRAEEALNKSQRLLAETEKVGKVGGWEFDIDTGKQIWTEETYRIHELDLTYDPTVEKGLNFYTPASRPIIERAVKGAIKRGEPFDLELEITTAKGNRRSVRAIGKVDAKNGRVYGFFQDITEQKQAEEAWREGEERLRLLIEYAPTALAMFDHDLRYLAVSRRWIGDYNLPDNLIGRAHYDLFPNLPERWKAAHRRGLAGEVVREEEDRFEHTDGRVQYARYEVRPWHAADGSIGGIVIFTEDVTERKRAAAAREKLEEQNLQLKKSASLSRMAGAVAHNFNNQLHAVIMNLELALDNLPPDAGTGANLSAAILSARKAAAISTQMLTYLGKTHAKYEPLDLSEACRRGLPQFQGDLPEAVVLETDLPAPGPVTSANATQIQQVLINLLTNACEASREGSGPIRLTVKLVSAAAIPAVNRFPMDWQPRDPAYACLEVADSGCGIEPRDIEELFDPFFSTKFTGRGLGLAIVLGIVREHGGCITLESEPGRGSAFRVFLPVTAAAVPPKPLPAASAPKTTGHGTVLVVEDEPAVRATITKALQRTGFTVIAAVDGVEAVELFGQHRDEICCVLCDMTMPRMGGWETLNALRKLAPGLPVILSSGYDEANVMEGHHPELPQAYLRKPYEMKALFNTISQIRPKVRAEKGEGSS